MSENTFMGVPRSSIDWCPRIDYSKCNSECTECIHFCPHDVFEICKDESQRLVIKNPLNCVVFCRACALTCGFDALGFPDKAETTTHIKQIRKAGVVNG